MAPGRGDRSARRDTVTSGLTFLGLAVGVLGPFGMLVVGIENDEPILAAMGVFLGAFVVALVLRRRPV